MANRIARAGRRMTAAELLNMPDDGCRYELVRGELVTMPPAGLQHGGYASNIHVPLAVYARANNLGRTYIAAGPASYSAPTPTRCASLTSLSSAKRGWKRCATWRGSVPALPIWQWKSSPPPTGWLRRRERLTRGWLPAPLW